MPSVKRDPGLDALLELDGQVLVVDPDRGHWVKFVARRVPVTPEKPHGLDYSLTLHDRSGQRLVGYDNAHPVSSERKRERAAQKDHMHRLKVVKPYEYKDAATLLADFWTDVDAVLKEKGVIR